MVRKKNKDIGIARPATQLLVGGVVLGVGSSIVGKIGGATAVNAQAGLTTVSSFLPVIGTGLGSFIVVRQLRNLEESIKRKRRK